MGASESSLLFVHTVDSAEDLGEVCSGCDGDGRNVSCGISFGSAGIGSSGCEVAVFGIGLGIVVVDDAMSLRGGVEEMGRRSVRRRDDATKGTASASHG